VRVARCAELLAARYGADTAKARLAGMLHDIARLWPPARLLAECDRRSMPVDEVEREAPVLLHARLGAAVAAERFGVSDPEILGAIAKHTAADARMSALDCALYLADSLEPGRDFPERPALWAIACADMREGMRATLKATLGYVRKRGLPVAKQSLAAARAFGVES
jgi:predicted HD superfamily hydrolase involved in NAD metabolism